MAMVVEAFCFAWLLTGTCTDDAIQWCPSPHGTFVTWAGSTLLVPPEIHEVRIGC